MPCIAVGCECTRDHSGPDCPDCGGSHTPGSYVGGIPGAVCNSLPAISGDCRWCGEFIVFSSKGWADAGYWKCPKSINGQHWPMGVRPGRQHVRQPRGGSLCGWPAKASTLHDPDGDDPGASCVWCCAIYAGRGQ